MLNLFGRMAAGTLSSQPHRLGDPLAPPKDKSDPRIYAVRRSYHTHCWVWRDAATADAARVRVWEETYKRPLDDALINLCGQPRCVRKSHLQRITAADQDTLSQILQYADGGGREGVARAGALIQILSRKLDWDHREWKALLNVTESTYKQGIADYEAQVAAIRKRSAARQSATAAAEPASPVPAAPAEAVVPATESVSPAGVDPAEAVVPATESVSRAGVETVGAATPATESVSRAGVELAEAVAPAPALSQPAAAPTPAMPVLLRKGGPLGQPTNLTAQPGRVPGQVELAWAPAANAALQIVVVGMPGTSESATHPQALWGSDGAVTLGEMTAGIWHFAILAGQSPAPDNNEFTWSEPSNWVAIELS